MTTTARSRSTLPRLAAFVTLSAVGLAAAIALDQQAALWFVSPKARNEDWHRMFRVMGYMPLWILAAAALALYDWRTARERGVRIALRAVYVIASTGAGGGIAELLKLAIRRERPDLDAPGYVFRAFDDRTWSTSGLGLPSSHAAIAFAAAGALCKLFPSAWPVWITLAMGCATTRMLDGAHFLSDVVLAAIVGLACAWLIARLGPRDPQATLREDRP
jgi:membrane-associated phospholipid phosphatase